MKIETTLNISIDDLKSLTFVARKMNISKSRIITILFYEIMKRKSYSKIIPQRVLYQRRENDSSWHTLHISLPYDIYEKCLDMRKLWKMSVSLILNIAIKLYLNDLIKLKQKKITDNYWSQYLCIYSKEKSKLIYQVYWEIPEVENLKKLLE